MNKLTQEEDLKLTKFIGRCVLENAVFPSEKLGVTNVSIQELINERSIESLENYGEMLEKRVSNSGSAFKSKRPALKFGTILATELIDNLLLIIKHKEFLKEEKKLKAELREINSRLEESKTPEERKASDIARKQELETSLQLQS